MWLLLAIACTATGVPDKGAGDTDDGDSSDPDDSASTGADTGWDGDMGCTAALSPAITLVVGVDWRAPAGSTSYVDFGPTAAYGQRTPSTDTPSVHRDLIGNPPGADVYWRATSETPGGPVTCTGVTRTGAVPVDVPTLTVTTDTSAPDAPPYLLGAFLGLTDGTLQLVAMRRDGTVVWYWDGPAGGSLDVHYAVDGAGLLVNDFPAGQMGTEDATIHEVTFAGELTQTWETPSAHHTFLQLADGTLAYQGLDTRTIDDPHTGEASDWTGDTILELAPDGSRNEVYSTWDTLEPTYNDHMSAFSIYDGADWTHGNALKYLPAEDRYLLSLAHAGDVLTLDRSNGGVVSLYGADGVAASPPFDYQHDPTWLDDGHLLMFMTDDAGSGAIEYDLSGGAPVEVWRHGYTDAAVALGQATRLPNGDTFVNYGALQRLEEVSADGEVVWAAKPGDETPSTLLGQFLWTTDLYTGEP